MNREFFLTKIMLQTVILIFHCKDSRCMEFTSKQGIFLKHQILRLNIILILFFLILTGFTSVIDTNPVTSKVTAAIITVDANGGGDYVLIQDAIDNAEPGDTILVEPGTYYENITINKTLELIGVSGSDHTRIYADWTEDVVTINANECNISGFTIESIGAYSTLHIIGDNNRISDCICRGNVIGITFETSHLNLIENCICDSNSGAGMFLGNSSGNVIKNTKCINSTYGNGIYFFYSDYNTFSDGISNGNGDNGLYAYWLSNNNIIVNYTFNNNQRSGFYIMDSDNFIIENCTTIGNQKNGFIIESSGNTISDCTSISNQGDGFYLYHCEDSEITNNIVGKNGGKGFNLRYSDRNTISNNSFISNTGFGIRLGINSDSNLFFNNDLINNYRRTVQVEDNGSENEWHSSGFGNYWWDYTYHYPNGKNDGDIWDTPYDVSYSREIQDRKPLVEPRLSLDEVKQVHPGVFDDVDADGVFDLIDAYPFDSTKWKKPLSSLILGPIVDETGIIVKDAKVILIIDGTKYTNRTDEVGLTIVDIPSTVGKGIYNISVTKEGYSDMSYSITINPDGSYDQGTIPELKKTSEDTKSESFKVSFLAIGLICSIIIIVIIFALVLKFKK